MNAFFKLPYHIISN